MFTSDGQVDSVDVSELADDRFASDLAPVVGGVPLVVRAPAVAVPVRSCRGQEVTRSQSVVMALQPTKPTVEYSNAHNTLPTVTAGR